MITRLPTRIVDKPWGVVGIDPKYGADPTRKIGEIWFEAPPQRPLSVMAKYLFTSERLSVQVHPNDAEAKAMGLKSGKDECWVVLDAGTNAELGIGTKAVMSADALIAAAKDGSIIGDIDWRRPKTGDFIYNPAGSVHALGPGLTVLEIQQSADVTFRLYDYGRDRPLHLEEARAVAKPTPHHDPLDRAIDRGASAVLADRGAFGVAWCHREAPALPQTRDLQVLPIDDTMAIDGEMLSPGQCALYDGDAAALRSGGNFVLAWAR